MQCYLCNSSNSETIHKGTRDNGNINVLRCKKCTLVYLSSTAHVKETLYENDGQAKSTEQIEVNAYNFDTEKRFNDYANALAGKSVLEFGCGRGAFAKKLKDHKITDHIYTLEPNLAYRDFLKDHFNHVADIAELKDNSLDYITMFHVMEHIADPIETLNSLHAKLKTGGRIIIEVPHSEDALLNLYGSKAFADFTYWSLHLYLFNRSTLELLASKTPYSTVYIKYHQRYGLSNHLHWLAKEKPGGQNQWFFMNNDELDHLYAKKLAEIGMTDTIVIALEK